MCQLISKTRAYQHAFSRPETGRDPICRQLFKICCHHSHNCQLQLNTCPVFLCGKIKQLAHTGLNDVQIVTKLHAETLAEYEKHKKKLIQQQLILLLHGAKCDKSSEEVRRACNVPHCATMRQVLSHLRGCPIGRSCKRPHCASSRQIIAHWKACKKTDCEVCGPLRESKAKALAKGATPLTSAADSNIDKKANVQRQLVLLLHAAKCQKPTRDATPNTNSGDLSLCVVPHCDTMKKVLQHLRGCTIGDSCTVPHCASSRRIIAHWKQCQDKECTVCEPLRRGRGGSVNAGTVNKVQGMDSSHQ